MAWSKRHAKRRYSWLYAQRKRIPQWDYWDNGLYYQRLITDYTGAEYLAGSLARSKLMTIPVSPPRPHGCGKCKDCHCAA